METFKVTGIEIYDDTRAKITMKPSGDGLGMIFMYPPLDTINLYPFGAEFVVLSAKVKCEALPSARE